LLLSFMSLLLLLRALPSLTTAIDLSPSWALLPPMLLASLPSEGGVGAAASAEVASGVFSGSTDIDATRGDCLDSAWREP
jgi:hypothetical protein